MSARDRLAEMQQQAYDPDIIRQCPELEAGGSDPGVVEVQNFLKRFGYLDFAPGALEALPEPGHLDEATLRALVELQMRYDIGTPGVLDAATRDFMVAPRCGMPDLFGRPSINFRTVCAWPRRNLSYQFGRPGASAITTDVPQGVAINAVRRALNTWANAGVGLTFRVITGGDIPIDADIRIEWRPEADPDHSMVGNVVAHADYPPDCWVVTNDYPKPLHFDDSERWVDGAVEGALDIETVALHELGHLLGLDHSDVAGSVMWPTVSYNRTLRTLQEDDLRGIRALYPTGSLAGLLGLLATP
jgi:Matrixin/Putative peptidoglycan binding domain